MSPWKFLLVVVLTVAFAIEPAAAGGDGDGGDVIEVVTFRLNPGVSIAEFAPIDKAVELEHISKQPGFVSRESAFSADNECLVVVHWRSEKYADASIATFNTAPAAAMFMSKIDASTMSMKRYKK